MLSESNSDKAVSPVIGVILMIAIVVILSAVIGGITLQLGNNATEGTTNIGSDIQTTNDGKIAYKIIEDPPNKILLETDQKQKTIENPSVGNTYFLDPNKTNPTLTIIGENKNGAKNIIRTTTITVPTPYKTNPNNWKEPSTVTPPAIEGNTNYIGDNNAVHRAYIPVDNTGSGELGSSLGSIKIDYSLSSNQPDLSEITQSDIQKLGIDEDQDGKIETSVKSDFDGINKQSNGILRIELTGNYNLDEASDVVIVQYKNVKNPSQTGTYNVQIDLNAGSSVTPEDTTITYEKLN